MNIILDNQKIKQAVIGLRREFHQIPEVGFKEYKTAKRIAAYLKAWGYQVKTGIGGTGVVGLLSGNQINRTIAVRADIDGLPVEEKTGLTFKSQQPGKMHACGHDSHIAIALATAKVIAEFHSRLKGNVKFIFQPAEELLAGARAMLEQDNPLQNPEVNAIIGLHNWPGLEKGTIGIKDGPLMAAADHFEIILEGKGGHGAMPEKTIDPVVMGSQLVLALQNIVSRELSPLDVAVISIGSFESNSAPNIIPDKVVLKGTVRTLNKGVREFIKTRMEEVIAGITSMGRGHYHFDYIFRAPALVNDWKFTKEVEKLLQDKLGQEKITRVDKTSMVSEDFAFFLEQVPGTYLLLGTGNKDAGLHHAHYSIDEEILPTGVKAFLEIIFDQVF
jgi:amidohydrolase